MDEVGRICVQIGVNIFPSLFDKCVKFNKIVNFIKIYIYIHFYKEIRSQSFNTILFTNTIYLIIYV